MLLPLRGANEAGKRYSDENILGYCTRSRCDWCQAVLWIQLATCFLPASKNCQSNGLVTHGDLIGDVSP